MNIYHSFDEAAHIRNAVVTTGSFDGVHAGHRAIIQRLNNLAREVDGESTLVTFYPHPRKVLYPETEGKNLRFIFTQDEKTEVLRETGLQNLIVIQFTQEFSQISSRSFIQDLLVGIVHARMVVTGFNHHFGFNREGDYTCLQQFAKEKNFRVEEIPAQEIQNETVSSTKIRNALFTGNIQRANAYLSSLYFISGQLEHGNAVLTRLGFPTFRLVLPFAEKLIPPDGVYAIRFRSSRQYLRGMCSIKGNADPSGNKGLPYEPRLEFHLFEEGTLSEGECGKLYFYKRVRDSYHFQNTEEMRQQLMLDKENINEMIY